MRQPDGRRHPAWSATRLASGSVRRLAAARPPAVSLAAFDPARRPGIVGGILPTILLPALVLPSFGIQEGAAARTTPLLGEERTERRNRVDLAAAGPAREARHGRILASAAPLVCVRCLPEGCPMTPGWPEITFNG